MKLEHLEIIDKYPKDAIDFQRKVLERSDIGNETYLPDGLHQLPMDNSLNSSVAEAERVLFSVVQDLFSKHMVNPRSIDIIITNCTLLCPTPSLASMIIKKFGLRSNVMSYSLSSMGCSASILSISLAKELLKVHKNCLALVLSMESICSNVYHGKFKSMLLANCLFRMGGTAILLSNRTQDKHKAKYELQHIVRTHLGSRDSCYNSVVQEDDNEGYKGINLSRSILHSAGESLKVNMSSLGLLVLPYSQQILYGLSFLSINLWPAEKKKGVYIPNFRKAFQHFCIHAGGKSVIEGIKENLKLSSRDVEASKMTLYRFGNTSSSSIWYCLSYLEAKGRLKKGDRVWQLAFGSGFKCNSAVWKCISKLKPVDYSNAWSDRIHEYPVEVPEIIDH
ncbi:FAE1/Type III polyketide synthase-like protein [Dillenia turbinata]|uniref:very-long-chain 3-oxoacyl-CoA synthase n=1 Tax=Dillenia turbinata TaxID=194707 RepID=A0AAN8URY6_9MAGN